MANPNYLGFPLAKLLNFLELCLKCVEFLEYLENLCEKMAELPKYQ